MRRTLFTMVFNLSTAGLISLAVFNSASAAEAPEIDTNNVAAVIRDIGMNHSEVMTTLSYLSDVIGPRLTGSPNLKRANEWTRGQLTGWGLTNAHLEAWGPFGRGWSLKRFSAQLVEPQCIPLIACPSAWSPGLEKAVVGNVVLFDVRTNADLEKYKGKLKGAVVLVSPVREVRPHFEPQSVRFSESNLLQYANAGESRGFGFSRAGLTRIGAGRTGGQAGAREGNAPGGGTNRARFAAMRSRSAARYFSFLAQEGAAVVVNASPEGDGGTIFVAGASVPITEGQTFTNLPRAWSTNAPALPPQITVAAEDYNRLMRMLEHGEKLKMAVDLQVQFHDDDLMCYNTVAEIPGLDLKDEVVMVGGHLDSWHSGTGATDNGIGVAVAMEAMRILKSLSVKPRRTIRIALWSGEEEGLLGSKAYVARHFGYYTNVYDVRTMRSPKNEDAGESTVKRYTNSVPSRRLIRLAEYEKLSVYLNLDNGAGRVRGVYLQGNEAARAVFRRWLEPLRDLDAETLTLSNTSGTDHISFDAIGLPGFQFIQDPLEYRSRTHHSNEDVYDRVLPEDAKQAAVVMATCAWDAAMSGAPMPRQPQQ